MSCIGVDFGTAYSTVGVITKSGEVEVIANDQGNRTTPSYVAYTETGSLVGESAFVQASMNTANTVFNIKSVLGLPLSDAGVAALAKTAPFTVQATPGDDASVSVAVECEGKATSKTAVEVAAALIGKLKFFAESYLSSAVDSIVLALPVTYTPPQVAALRAACELAGLAVKHTVSEAVAVAIAYEIDAPPAADAKSVKDEQVLVFDVGGHSADATVLQCVDGVMEVRAQVSSTEFAGEYLDTQLMTHFSKEFKRANDVDIMTSGDQAALHRLRQATLLAKHTLSTSSSAAVEVDSLFEGIDFFTTVTKSRFELLNAKFFRGVTAPVTEALAQAGVSSVTQISRVLLVGGCARLPKLQQQLGAMFPHLLVADMTAVDVDEAVVRGATMQADILARNPSTEALTATLPCRVTSLDVGVAGACGAMDVVVRRNTRVPCSFTHTYVTADVDQSSVLVAVYEGLSSKVADNTLLCKLSVGGLAARARGAVRVPVTIAFDKDGVMTVSSGTAVSLKVTGGKAQATTAAAASAAKTKWAASASGIADDVAFAAATHARNTLYSYLAHASSIVQRTDLDVTDAGRAAAEKLIAKAYETAATTTASAGGAAALFEQQLADAQEELDAALTVAKEPDVAATEAAMASASMDDLGGGLDDDELD